MILLHVGHQDEGGSKESWEGRGRGTGARRGFVAGLLVRAEKVVVFTRRESQADWEPAKDAHSRGLSSYKVELDARMERKSIACEADRVWRDKVPRESMGRSEGRGRR